jgi:hypothetical protein
MNPAERIELLQRILDQLIESIEEILLSGEEIPDDIQGQLADEIAITMQEIQTLQASMQPQEAPAEAPPPPTPQQPEGQIPSSNINRFAYDPKTKSLLVKFQGDYPQENGPVYQYSNVPEQIFEVFRRGAIPAKTNGQNRWGRWWRGKSPSLGASFYEAIRQGGYPFQRVG